MMMHDPEGKYQPIVQQFIDDPDFLDEVFSKAWYKLTTSDMGPVTRCLGPDVPEAQPFQYPLPPYDPAEEFTEELKTAIESSIRDVFQMPSSELIRLAWQCAYTFRVTDYRGGCNGARIRFPPQIDWKQSAGVAATLEKLEPIKSKYPSVSWADLIVLGGTLAIESATRRKMPFCPGRNRLRVFRGMAGPTKQQNRPQQFDPGERIIR